MRVLSIVFLGLLLGCSSKETVSKHESTFRQELQQKTEGNLTQKMFQEQDIGERKAALEKQRMQMEADMRKEQLELQKEKLKLEAETEQKRQEHLNQLRQDQLERERRAAEEQRQRDVEAAVRSAKREEIDRDHKEITFYINKNIPFLKGKKLTFNDGIDGMSVDGQERGKLYTVRTTIKRVNANFKSDNVAFEYYFLVNGGVLGYENGTTRGMTKFKAR